MHKMAHGNRIGQDDTQPGREEHYVVTCNHRPLTSIHHQKMAHFLKKKTPLQPQDTQQEPVHTYTHKSPYLHLAPEHGNVELLLFLGTFNNHKLNYFII